MATMATNSASKLAKISGTAGDSGRAPRISHLSKISDISRELRRIYRLSRTGELPTQDLSRYANVLMIMTHILRDDDLELRLELLEQAQNAQRQP